ncbi:hypothetical protein C8J57DRAFT_1223946 [Mycena rebaudengoi]|nr:hypothetical protein C8J57DRAFT_1223946 [Mycena rebaudengoi]
MGATVAPTITPVEILREENEQLADVEVADPEIPDEEVEDSLWIEEDVEIELDEFLPPLYPDCQLEPVSCGSARKSDSQKDSRTSATLLKKPVDTSEASSISAELGGCQSTERDRRAEAIGCIRETRVQDKSTAAAWRVRELVSGAMEESRGNSREPDEYQALRSAGVVAFFVTSLLRLFSRNLVTLIPFREIRQVIHLMLNITWHVQPFPSATTTTIAPAQGIGGIAGNVRRHPRQSFHHRVWQGHFSGKRLFWYSMACVMHGLGQTRREAQRTGTGRVDILLCITSHRVAAGDSVVPQRLGNGTRRGSVFYSA